MKRPLCAYCAHCCGSWSLYALTVWGEAAAADERDQEVSPSQQPPKTSFWMSDIIILFDLTFCLFLLAVSMTLESQPHWPMGSASVTASRDGFSPLRRPPRPPPLRLK